MLSKLIENYRKRALKKRLQKIRWHGRLHIVREKLEVCSYGANVAEYAKELEGLWYVADSGFLYRMPKDLQEDGLGGNSSYMGVYTLSIRENKEALLALVSGNRPKPSHPWKSYNFYEFPISIHGRHDDTIGMTKNGDLVLFTKHERWYRENLWANN